MVEGGIPHESWNFDFENPRNSDEQIFGYSKFTKAPKLKGKENLIVFYSQNHIVGFYGNAEVLQETVILNESESYNLIGSRPLCIMLKNKITKVKEKGYLEDKQRVGQVGFNYLEKPETIAAILNEAILLNPEIEQKLYDLKDWLQLIELNEPSYWVFQANPNNYRIVDALKANVLKAWAINQYRNQIRIGDKVIIWVSGKTAGIYALATITSPVHKAEDDMEELPYYTNKTESGTEDCVTLKMDYNLVHQPILKQKVLAHHILYNLKQGMPGTNFKATEEQYNAILKLTAMEDNKQDLNQILFGPPGTGKTYNTVNEALKIVDPEFYALNIENRKALTAKFKELLIKDWENPKGQIAFCTFHQSFSYEDFVEGIKPKTKKEEKRVYYEIEDGVFKNISRLGDSNQSTVKVIFTNKDREESIIEKEKKKYVLIIDEINRGNVSSIFGELITLIEKDKRAGGKEELEVTLPYSKESFKVPENVYIIATMNTADRSVEALDTALRRRFSFIEMPPIPSLIKSKDAALEVTDGKIDDVDVVKLLEIINARIEKLIDKDHKIGHSYFMHINTKDDLVCVFADKVIPLLEEYFFGDFGKIGLVLGNSFVTKEDNDAFEFAKFDAYNHQVQDLKERPVYRITTSSEWDFVSIYEEIN